MDYLLCGNLPYPAWKKHISVQNLSNRRIRRYLVCRLKRPEARDFSHVRFTEGKYPYDCLWCELYGSINAAYIDGDISEDHAWYLRERYLDMERV